jgi:integrase
MTNDPRRKIDLLREQIRDSETLSDRDRENLLAFSERLDLLKSEYSDQRHEKLLRHCAIMAGQSQQIDQSELPDVELSAALESEDAAFALLGWINARYDNEETNKDYRLALRMFGKRLNDGEVPESLESIPTTTSRNYNPTPNPADMLDWEDDVVPMVEATRNPRDAALIAVAWDSGARGGEITDLTVGDVTDSRHGLKLTLDGKTGQRSVLLVPSVPYLNRWLGEHPGDDSDRLWSKLTSPEPVTYQQLRKSIRSAAQRAGVSKPVTFTNFRKSQASHLASRGMNEATIKNRLGWSQGSSVASRYVSIFGEDSDREVARLHGADIEQEEPEPIAPVECPRCGRENPRDHEECMFCGQLLDVKAVQSVQDREREVRDAAMRLVAIEPDVLNDIQKVEDLMTVLDDRPALREEVEQLAAVLNDRESG